MTRTYPQPREGVRGTDRSGELLLSLAESSYAHRRAIAMLTTNLHRACLVGNPAPSVRKMYERMTSPRLGDLVVVLDATYNRREDVFRGLGYLLVDREEWYETNAEWEMIKKTELETGYVMGDDERMTDRARYVQYGTSELDVCRWVNCTVIAALAVHPWDDV